MRKILIYNQSHPSFSSIPIKAEYCNSFFCRLKGLMFRKNLEEYEGLLLVENAESRLNAAIHMLFMRFELAVIWINKKYQVVDLQHARQWRFIYIPSAPAKFILESHPDRIFEFQIGDQLTFNDE